MLKSPQGPLRTGPTIRLSPSPLHNHNSFCTAMGWVGGQKAREREGSGCEGGAWEGESDKGLEQCGERMAGGRKQGLWLAIRGSRD